MPKALGIQEGPVGNGWSFRVGGLFFFLGVSFAIVNFKSTSNHFAFQRGSRKGE